jgi:hypothetical protein
LLGARCVVMRPARRAAVRVPDQGATHWLRLHR